MADVFVCYERYSVLLWKSAVLFLLKFVRNLLFVRIQIRAGGFHCGIDRCWSQSYDRAS